MENDEYRRAGARAAVFQFRSITLQPLEIF